MKTKKTAKADRFKVTTHDIRPPLQGGEPQWSEVPVTLPEVRLDRSAAECGSGYHFCKKAEDALRLCGLWPPGRPSRLWVVRPVGDEIVRRDKARAAQIEVLRECDEDEVREAVRLMSEPWFTDLNDQMVDAQMAWRAALARPLHDEAAVQAGLRAALAKRGLDGWTLRRFDSPDAARAARAARAACDARDAWADARDAGDARAAWDARAAARAARAAARDAWAAARDAWAACDARDALMVRYAALRGWTEHDPELLTEGILDAYRNGLAVAIPTGPNTLGWAMVPKARKRSAK